MEGLTLSTKEQNRLHILNGVLERHWTMKEAAPLLGVSERQGWRVLAAYRKEGARGVVHKNRGRVPPNATPETIQQQVASLAQERYEGINHTHLAYRKEGARGVVHKNRGRVPPNATPETIQQQVASLAQERYEGI